MSSPLLSQIQQSVSELIAKQKIATSDGKVTFSEITELLVDASHKIVKLTQSLTADGVDKKAAAMEAFALFIDQVVTPLDIQAIPNLVEPFVDRLLRDVLLAIADGAIESAVNLYKQIGWK